MDGMLPGREYEYATLMNMLHVSVSKHLLDAHFTLVWANEFYYDLIGYGKDEYEAIFHNQCDTYYTNPALGFHDEEEWNKMGAVVMKAIAEGKPGYNRTARMRRRDGSYIWVQMTATFVDEYIDGCQVSYTVMTDVTETMQQQIDQSVTYDNLPGFVAKFRVAPGPQFALLDANDRFNEFFGSGPESGCGGESLFQENLRRNADVLGGFRSQFSAGEPVHFVLRAVDRHGQDAWLQVNAACTDRQSGEPVYLAIFIDITNETELRQMREALERQARELKDALSLAERANRAKSDFLSHMSHDIRTPMNAIVGMTDIAKVHLDDPDKVLDCLNKITLSSRHLLGLINDVLDMSKIENGNIMINTAPVSLPELLENVVTIIQPNIKANCQEFSVRLHGIRHERFRSDALRLRQILINLLSNASKFTPAGGSVRMDIEERSGMDGSAAELRIVISDTGIGMSTAYLAHIFEPFSREQDSRVDKTEGSGLGMAITRRLVELLGGSIEVDSRAGEGSTFTVILPMQIDDTPSQSYHFPDLHILVVDDGAVTREYMDNALRDIGLNADCADSGAGAVAMARAAHLAGRDYDAVILDWKMPGMDGLQTARLLREQVDGALPILIMSAYDWSEIEAPARSAGISGFLQKPIFRSTLCYGIQKFVLGRAAVKQETPTYHFSGKRLLLVEDNELNREIALEILQETGAQVDTANNGAQGVERFQGSPAGYYDLILMDIQMPVMDGLTAARTIRALPKADAASVPIVAMTADAFAEDVAAAKQAGMDDHIAKPIDVAQLYRMMEGYLQ